MARKRKNDDTTSVTAGEVAGDRKTARAGDISPGAGLDYVAGVLPALKAIAERSHHGFLAYLIDMALLEARAKLEAARRDDRRKGRDKEARAVSR